MQILILLESVSWELDGTLVSLSRGNHVVELNIFKSKEIIIGFFVMLDVFVEVNFPMSPDPLLTLEKTYLKPSIN